jgi:hypothetical protein
MHSVAHHLDSTQASNISQSTFNKSANQIAG